MTESPTPANAEPCLPAAVRPLTRRRQSGEVYLRPPEVQRVLEATAGMTFTALVRRARATDTSAGDYLPSECLVYCVREAHRAGQRQVMNSLMEALLRRSVGTVARLLHSLPGGDPAQAAQDVISTLTRRIVDLSGDDGDFYQVRYMLGLQSLVTTVYGQYRRRANQSLAHRRIGNPDPQENERQRDVDVPDDHALDPAELAACREALGHLPEPLRELFVLRAYGWPIESNDPSVPSLDAYFGVSARTIRNRLDRARSILEPWRERQQS